MEMLGLGRGGRFVSGMRSHRQVFKALGFSSAVMGPAGGHWTSQGEDTRARPCWRGEVCPESRDPGASRVPSLQREGLALSKVTNGLGRPHAQ